MIRLRQIIRLLIIRIRYLVYTKVYGMHISNLARISVHAKLDLTYPKGINIAEGAYIASGAIIFAHDYTRNMHKATYIGRNTFIGANSIIMCGVHIGDEVIVGAGSIVTKDVPSNSIVAGNPARIIRVGIHTTNYGQLVGK